MQQEMNLEFLKKIDQQAVSALERNRVVYYTAKRTLDVLLALIMLLVLSPVMLLIALAIKLDSPGPVLFVQKRVGARRRGREGLYYWKQETFPCFKFRTMTHNVDSSLHERFVQAYINNDEKEMKHLQGGDHSLRKLVNDPRITRVGRFLRKASLDELPQLFNVLRDEMSMVGPRPAICYELKYFKPWHFKRLQAQPGITGLWQIRARGSTDFDYGVCLDIEYVEKQSIGLDLAILAQTPIKVLFGKGAV